MRVYSFICSTSGNQQPKVQTVHATVSPVKRINVGDSKAEAKEGRRPMSPMRARLMNVMSQVEKATESVQKVIENSNIGGVRYQSPMQSNRAGAAATIDADSKNGSSDAATCKDTVGSSASGSGGSKAEVVTYDASYSVSQGQPSSTAATTVDSGGGSSSEFISDLNAAGNVSDDDDLDGTLEYTLQSWLSTQKRGVTVRNKHGNGSSRLAGDGSGRGVAADEKYAESNRQSGMDTPTMVDMLGKQGNDYLEESEYDLTVNGGHFESFEPYDEDGEGDGHNLQDVEVVGLQCMLAKALMGDDDLPVAHASDDDDKQFR